MFSFNPENEACPVDLINCTFRKRAKAQPNLAVVRRYHSISGFGDLYEGSCIAELKMIAWTLRSAPKQFQNDFLSDLEREEVRRKRSINHLVYCTPLALGHPSKKEATKGYIVVSFLINHDSFK